MMFVLTSKFAGLIRSGEIIGVNQLMMLVACFKGCLANVVPQDLGDRTKSRLIITIAFNARVCPRNYPDVRRDP